MIGYIIYPHFADMFKEEQICFPMYHKYIINISHLSLYETLYIFLICHATTI